MIQPTAQPQRRRPGRPPRLTRDAIVRAGLAIADDRGLDAVTMQNVATALDAKPMSLYRHVRDKEDLVDGMVDLVFDEAAAPSVQPDWTAALREAAGSMRTALMRHRWAIGLMESRVQPGPANLGFHDAVLGVLLASGFTSVTATRAYNLVDSYVYGFALQEASLPVATPEAMADVADAILEAMPEDRFPHLGRVGRDLMTAGFDYRAEFEIGLDLILDTLARSDVAPVRAP